jgi:hypothetical protein
MEVSKDSKYPDFIIDIYYQSQFDFEDFIALFDEVFEMEIELTKWFIEVGFIEWNPKTGWEYNS